MTTRLSYNKTLSVVIAMIISAIALSIIISARQLQQVKNKVASFLGVRYVQVYLQQLKLVVNNHSGTFISLKEKWANP
jgi:hypothetical protein